jgi:hypothetical protein
MLSRPSLSHLKETETCNTECTEEDERFAIGSYCFEYEILATGTSEESQENNGAYCAWAKSKKHGRQKKSKNTLDEKEWRSYIYGTFLNFLFSPSRTKMS